MIKSLVSTSTTLHAKETDLSFLCSYMCPHVYVLFLLIVVIKMNSRNSERKMNDENFLDEKSEKVFLFTLQARPS